MKYVIDAHAWIEYFEGNKSGEKVRKIIENPKNEIITNILNLSEISSFFQRKGINSNQPIHIIFSISKIYNFDSEFSIGAGTLHGKIKKQIKNFGLIDAFILLTARKLNAKVLTGNFHFKGFKEAVMTS